MYWLKKVEPDFGWQAKSISFAIYFLKPLICLIFWGSITISLDGQTFPQLNLARTVRTIEPTFLKWPADQALRAADGARLPRGSSRGGSRTCRGNRQPRRLHRDPCFRHRADGNRSLCLDHRCDGQNPRPSQPLDRLRQPLSGFGRRRVPLTDDHGPCLSDRARLKLDAHDQFSTGGRSNRAVLSRPDTGGLEPRLSQ